MKTTERVYKQGNLLTFSPSFEISYSEIMSKTSDENVINYVHNLSEYDEFCRNQTATGQRRKNQRRRKRNQLLAVPKEISYVFDEVSRIKKEIHAEKIATLQSFEIEIEFDGRKKRNLPRFIEAIGLDLNVGGISPQYKSLGFVGYSLKK